MTPDSDLIFVTRDSDLDSTHMTQDSDWVSTLRTRTRTRGLQDSNTSLLRDGVSWPSGLAYRTHVLVLAAECGFESRP